MSSCTARSGSSYIFFFFNDTATTEIYTLSLHDALPISVRRFDLAGRREPERPPAHGRRLDDVRSEEHTSELQSQSNLVCRLLLEKKKNTLFFQSPSPVRSILELLVLPVEFMLPS